jgi:hypothetical protein
MHLLHMIASYFADLVTEDPEYVYLHNCPKGEETSYTAGTSYETKCSNNYV